MIETNTNGGTFPAPVSEHLCRACGGGVPLVENKENLEEHGDHIHTACLDKKHTFFAVDFDGDGGPACDSRDSAELFIKEEVENHNDPDITADLYSIKEIVLTWREHLAAGEWDGY